MSVTLMLYPSLIARVIAGRPSFVAGILTMTFFRSIREASCRTSAFVASVSRAFVGVTSTLT